MALIIVSLINTNILAIKHKLNSLQEFFLQNWYLQSKQNEYYAESKNYE